MEQDRNLSFSHILTTGFAMFSMFFGAGNVVFPLSIGQTSQDQNFFAILGLLITAVGVPFMGLLSMTLFNGDYKKFFSRMGPTTGFFISLIIMGLIGPFGAIPRCIALSYQTIQLFLPPFSLEIFSLLSCIVIFIFTIRKNNIVDILGKYLTPTLIVALGIIIVKGVLTAPPAPASDESNFAIFLEGLKEGYQTMDLLGAFFFSSVVISCLRKDTHGTEKENQKSILKQMFWASLVGAILLSVIYIGFSYVAAFNSYEFSGIPKDELLGRMAITILGPYGGLVASIAVALACLTTAIALAAVSAEFIHNDISNNRINYSLSLIITLIISYFVSTLNFTGIVMILAPILEVFYPALMLLSIMNILYRLYNVQAVKVPVWALFFISLTGTLISAFKPALIS